MATDQLAPRPTLYKYERDQMNQSDRQEWARQIIELFQRYGAERGESTYHWFFETTVGPMSIRIEPLGDHKVEGLGSLDFHFEDAERARQKIDCSLIRGLVSLWYFGGWTIETALQHLERQLKKVCAFRIRVLGAEADQSTDYLILADTETDARVIAFCLDGGHKGYTIERGHIELAKTYTEVL